MIMFFVFKVAFVDFRTVWGLGCLGCFWLVVKVVADFLNMHSISPWGLEDSLIQAPFLHNATSDVARGRDAKAKEQLRLTPVCCACPCFFTWP